MGLSVSDTVGFVTRSCLVFDVSCETQYSIKDTYFMNHLCPINFKVYQGPKCRYLFGMTELNYDTRMCEYGLHSYKIQFAGKSQYTSPCMLVLNQRWRRVWTNQIFASWFAVRHTEPSVTYKAKSTATKRKESKERNKRETKRNHFKFFFNFIFCALKGLGETQPVDIFVHTKAPTKIA